ncbi:hypothetical protein N6H14_05515 [Paenibacillus sp. CC-CFT747]|nr:hypothetical protein N6H14_05515 [Paenibacillus sp. CC-CFT747]
MLHDHIEFHNTAELEESRSFGGVKLFRFPREVRHALGDRGRFISEEATDCELRFVTEAAHVRVTLLLPDRAGEVYVYRGGLLHSTHAMPAGIPKTLHLERPVRLAGMDREKLTACGFAPEVWRVVFGRSEGVFLELNTFGEAVRPPQAGETPEVRLLAYGSSITHGLGTYPLTYVDQGARRLKADLFNKGMSGSCLCEPEMADYLARSKGWDAALLELGVNMRDHFPPTSLRSGRTICCGGCWSGIPINRSSWSPFIRTSPLGPTARPDAGRGNITGFWPGTSARWRLRIFT